MIVHLFQGSRRFRDQASFIHQHNGSVLAARFLTEFLKVHLTGGCTIEDAFDLPIRAGARALEAERVEIMEQAIGVLLTMVRLPVRVKDGSR